MTVHKITLYKMTHTLTNICQSTVFNIEKKIPHSRTNKINVKKIQTRKLSTRFMTKVQNYDILLFFYKLLQKPMHCHCHKPVDPGR